MATSPAARGNGSCRPPLFGAEACEQLDLHGLGQGRVAEEHAGQGLGMPSCNVRGGIALSGGEFACAPVVRYPFRGQLSCCQRGQLGKVCV